MMLFRNITLNILRVGRKFNLSYSTVAELKTKEEKIRIAKWDINYIKVGKGAHHVLLMPGSLGTKWTDFRPQIEGFDREQFTIVAWDPPGYGKSRPPNKDWTIDYIEKDADYAHAFMKALNIPNYSIVGWSDGATSSLVHAAKYPNAMLKVVSIAARPITMPEELEYYKSLYDVNQWSESMKANLSAVYGDYFIDYWIQCVEATEANCIKNKGSACFHLLNKIKCPVFILHGAKDIIANPVHSHYLFTGISDSRIHLYSGGKHNIHIKYASDFNKRVQEFLLQP